MTTCTDLATVAAGLPRVSPGGSATVHPRPQALRAGPTLRPRGAGSGLRR